MDQSHMILGNDKACWIGTSWCISLKFDIIGKRQGCPPKIIRSQKVISVLYRTVVNIEIDLNLSSMHMIPT